MSKKILKLLYRSFDQDLSSKEHKLLDKALESSPELRQEKERIASQRRALEESGAQSFSPFFTERVINRITSTERTENGLEVLYKTLKVAFQRIAIVGAIVMLILITFNLNIKDSLSTEEVIYASDATYEEIRQLPLF
jgi:hypothetical protein